MYLKNLILMGVLASLPVLSQNTGRKKPKASTLNPCVVSPGRDYWVSASSDWEVANPELNWLRGRVAPIMVSVKEDL